MSTFFKNHWYNVVSLAILVISMAFMYGVNVATITFVKEAIVEVKDDIKDINNKIFEMK